MTRKPCVNRANLPTTLPIWPTITLWLLLDRLAAPGWVLGVVWTLWTVIFLICFFSLFTDKPRTPVFEKEDP